MKASGSGLAAHVLVVEDEPPMLEWLTRTLIAGGHVVVGVDSGAEALRQFRAHEPDIVITDVRMPGMDGVEVLRAIRRSAPDCEVIVLTAYANLDTTVECLRAGAFDLLQKPADPREVLLAVDRALERRRLRDTARLYVASQAILSAGDQEELLEAIIRVTMEVMAADAASLLMHGADGRLHLACSHGLTGEERQASPIRLGERVAGRIAASRAPALIEESLDEDPRLADLPACKRVRSSIIYPLIAGDRLVGVLCINRTARDLAFRRADLDRATILASQVVLALENDRLRRQVVASERLAVIGQLAAGVAHEINNPLSFVMSNIESFRATFAELERLVADEPDDDAPREGLATWWRWLEGRVGLTDLREALDDAGEGARRIRAIVGDLRNLAHSDDHDAVVFNVGEVIDSALRMTRAQVQRCAQVIRKGDTAARVRGNPGGICQIFINLLSNAVQALGDRQDGEITISCQQANGLATVDVADNGPGILAEHLHRIFEPFFTTKAARDGTGMGLALSRQIALRHGGDLLVKSIPGAGATFTVVLPVVEQVSSAAMQQGRS
jgi:two-component system, NtrC family, sensor kinase